MIDDGRIQYLNSRPVCENGSFVLYWMQQAQRADYNHALAYAINQANDRDQSVLVCFGLTDDYPEANERHFAFMLEGLAETASELADNRIKLVIRHGAPHAVAHALSEQASLVVCDRGYLRHQRAWRRDLAEKAPCRVVQVETDAVVPVETASNKAEYAARTIRKKINGHRDSFLRSCKMPRSDKSSLPLHITGDVDLRDWNSALNDLKIDRSVKRASRFVPGPKAARARLHKFVRDHLQGYTDARNDPASPECSQLSPYLHFGQISPVEIAVACQQADHASGEDKEAFLEELIVRRELAMNFVFFTDDYDSYDCLPEWARKSLSEHRDDEREHVYTINTLENADTHDPAWNAAMTEMIKTGYMHNHMRMYWGKKIIEWRRTPESAYKTALKLNNRYFLDGRDPNSYANVAWLFGLHDRAWQERKIFGKIRYMNRSGLERKFDVDAYIEWSASL